MSICVFMCICNHFKIVGHALYKQKGHYNNVTYNNTKEQQKM